MSEKVAIFVVEKETIKKQTIMNTYKIYYKDQYTNGRWGVTSYVSPEEVTNQFLVDFFGLNECEEYKIEKI